MCDRASVMETARSPMIDISAIQFCFWRLITIRLRSVAYVTMSHVTPAPRGSNTLLMRHRCLRESNDERHPDEIVMSETGGVSGTHVRRHTSVGDTPTYVDRRHLLFRSETHVHDHSTPSVDTMKVPLNNQHSGVK